MEITTGLDKADFSDQSVWVNELVEGHVGQVKLTLYTPARSGCSGSVLDRRPRCWQPSMTSKACGAEHRDSYPSWTERS